MRENISAPFLVCCYS